MPRTQGPGRSGSTNNTPLFHYSGNDIRSTLNDRRDLEGTVWDAVTVDFVNPETGNAPLSTLGYSATLLRPGEATAPSRSTAGTFCTAISGKGYTMVDGQRLDWNSNDLFVVPNHRWHHHVNESGDQDAIFYSISDRPLLERIGSLPATGPNDWW